MTLVCDRLSKTYAHNRRTVVALDDVTFRVAEGEFVCIVGSSGCGKTTLLKIIAGLVRPSAGVVTIDRAAADGRPATALVFQDHALFPWMSVIENVAFGMRMKGVAAVDRRDRAASFLSRVGLGAFLHSHPHQLSAGMRQRVAIARALLHDADVLLMDEPFAALDALTKLALQEELLRLWQERRCAVVYVTHDIEEAVQLADRVLVMTGGNGERGRIRDEFPVELPRPRDLIGRQSPDIQSMTRRIWRTLEGDVRRQLSLPVSP